MGRPHPKASSFARTRASTHQTQAYLNPHKVPIKPNANPRPVQKPAFLTDDVRQTQQLANQVGNSSQDLQLQIRSEIGNDGDDTYLETYAENIYTAIVNIFAYKRFDNYFLLGSANNAGLLGSTQVGSITGSSSRIDEIQSIQDFSENFTSTTYKDSYPSTTAAGWGTGSLVFGNTQFIGSSKSIYQFESLLTDANGYYNGSFFGGNFNHGSYGPTGVALVAGKIGGSSIGLNGGGSVIITGNSTMNGSSFSVACWIKPDQIRIQGIVGHASAAGSRWRLFMSTTGGSVEFDGMPGEIGNASTTSPMSIGTWYHIAATFNQSTGSALIYFNGSLEGSALGITTYNNENTSGTGSLLSLGFTASTRFNGSIDDFRLYQKALTSSEIAGLYNNGSGLAGSPQNMLVVGFLFDNDSGTTAFDYSGSFSFTTTGKNYAGLHFTGSNQRFCISNGGIGIGSAGNVGFWFQPQTTFSTTSGSASTQTLWTSYTSDDEPGGNSLIALQGNDYVSANKAVGSLIFKVESDGQSAIRLRSKGITEWTAGSWYHVWATWQRSGSITLLINGSRHDTTTITGSAYSIIGSSTLGGGTVDSVADLVGGFGSCYNYVFDDYRVGSTYDEISPLVINGSALTIGSVAVFANWKSGSYNLTTFDRIRIDILFGSYGGSLTTFEASFNGGSNYTTIYPTSESILTNTGSDFRLKITDQHGSLVLTKVDIITKGTNFT